ncbi:fibroblast growth factor-binding protein 3 [Brachyhypopomus gauderio]|uniref:fibroblast growth factor-binding protein 3 n=1 Tax=Brachyhypopomus gauderio TaxID=698409 RepID=UPI0040437FA4
MRNHPSPLFILSLLFLILLPCYEAKKKTRPKSEATATTGDAATQTVLSSGELNTKDGHRCTWAALEGGNSVLLQVRCSTPAGEGPQEDYACQFSGKPQECSAYTAQSAQYWKQVVGKLKKKSHACEGEKVLKTRLCKKGPAAAHMKLTETKTADASGKREPAARRSGGKEAAREKRKQAKEEEQGEEPMQSDGEAAFGDGGELAADTQAAERYCGEGWQSVCRFFVKLLDG